MKKIKTSTWLRMTSALAALVAALTVAVSLSFNMNANRVHNDAVQLQRIHTDLIQILSDPQKQFAPDAMYRVRTPIRAEQDERRALEQASQVIKVDDVGGKQPKQKRSLLDWFKALVRGRTT